jgi:hypothetical protein
MVPSAEILKPIVALAAWSMVMWIWMYATRVPAIIASGMVLDPNTPTGQQMSTLPPRVRWKADNYNHLMEQPVVFYALALSLAIAGAGGGMAAQWAWGYVVVRVIHSLFQALSNKITVRFAIFVVSNIPLFALTYFAIVAVTS